MDIFHSFVELATEVGRVGVVMLTPRDLMRMVDAKRRGVHVVGEIRSRLARHSLRTEPDFAEVGADQSIEVVRTDEHRPPYIELLEQAAERLRMDPPSPMRVTPRTMLGWFDAKRRGINIMESVDATLAGFELQTQPDFRSVHLDQPVALVGRGIPTPDNGETDSTPEASEQAPATAATAPSAPPADTADSSTSRTTGGSSNNTFHIGTLPEADREVVRIKPQSTLRVALSTMISRQVSHLPIMRNERDVTGMLRWKDLGRYLLHNGGVSLEDPVERAQGRAVEVRYDQPFLDVVPDILKHGYVLVRGSTRMITGIVTKKDLGRQFLDLASPFVLLGEIERGLRALIENGDFTAHELRELALDPASPRQIKSVADLTLGEYQRLLSSPSAWSRIDLTIDKATFIEQLSEVRTVRNSVMHFHPDGTNDDDRRQLTQFLELVYDLQRFSGA